MSLPLPEQPSRNRSASTGDSGLPKHEHKRPRLSESQDSDQKILPVSVSNENVSSTSQQPTSSSLHSDHATSALTTPPLSRLPSTEVPDVTSPQSKVTINTRPISSQSFNLLAGTEPVSEVTKPAHSKTPAADMPGPPKPNDQHDTISISSDEGDSPIIQVAVPEDLDQDPSETQWEPVAKPTSSQRLPIGSGHVQRTFPYADNANKAPVLVGTIARAFLEGELADDSLFQKIRTWMMDFANNANGLNYDFFEEDRDFWHKFPNLVHGLLRRRVDPPPGLQVEDLVDFLLAYARITQLVVDANVAKFQSYPDNADPKTIVAPHFPNFLIQLPIMINSQGVPLYDNLQEAFDISPTVVTEMVMDKLLVSYAAEHLQSIKILFEALSDLFSKRPQLVEPGLSLVAHAGFFVNLLADRATNVSSEPAGAGDNSMALLSISSDFLQTVNTILDRAITKQQPWLNIETCEKVFSATMPFVNAIGTNFPQLAVDLVLTANVKPSLFQDGELAMLAGIAWRLSTQLKFIKKGRMEVRVTCVAIMAQDLVDVYNDHIRTSYNKDLEHPRVQFMIQFIRENNIIRYMIGVDSHPQIIERCANIIGFLCVSRSYCNEDTDVLWQTILESQDPRAVAALLVVFQNNLENLDVDVLCYIAKKILLLPFEQFNVPILDFALRLLNVGNIKAARDILSTQDEIEMDECIYRFCFKMLREANAPSQICTELSTRVRTNVQGLLVTKLKYSRGNLRLGEDSDLLHQMFVELCNDIRAHTDFACGSIVAFGIMLSESDNEECSRVVAEHDIATIFIDDVTDICNITLSPNPRESIWTEYDSRLNLMITLVFRTSHLITDVLLKRLWTNILSSVEVSPRIRFSTWSALANIFEPSRMMRNDTLDRIIGSYLQDLPPSLYDEAVLKFVKLSVKYEMFHSPMELMEPEDIVTIPGIERVWNIMLTAPTNKIVLEASQFIIEQYLDGERVSRRDASTIESTHLSLIDRCVQQVIDAAGHLKTSQDVAMSNVNTTPSPDEPHSSTNLHVMRFHRSLVFLRRFLDNLKTKPRYTPAVNDNLKKVLSTFDTKGQPFEVTLQIIGHKSLANIQFKWILGNNNSGNDVWQFLSDVTGWSQFTIISGGRRLTLKDEEKSLQDLGVKTGSFMINKIQGSPENAPSRGVRASSPVDSKVMHHFDELYSLLELNDQFAKEVFDFLSMFSTQEEVVQRIKSRTMAPEKLLPVEKPFKLMYYARALRSCIEDESFSPQPSTEFLIYGIQTILSVLPSVGDIKAETPTSISIAHGLVEALILGFRARVPTDVSCSYISNGTLFCTNILALWSQALEIDSSLSGLPATAALVRAPFEALIEGLLHDERIWSNLSISDFSACLRMSLLLDTAQPVRQSILDVIHGLTGVINTKSMAKSNESRTPRVRFPTAIIENCLERVWKILVEMMQYADAAAATCEEYFDATASTFRSYQQKLSQDEIRQHLDSWRSLLLTHEHSHLVGLAPHDFFVASLGKLMMVAIKAIEPTESQPETTAFVSELVSSFLFPPLNETAPSRRKGDVSSRHHKDPILDMHTRWVLYELILALSHDQSTIETVCDELNSDLVPKDIYFQPTMNHDRQSLRSEAGYSGLRNLSNTCYLNSLISQLFMNVEFRELVMNVNIIDLSKQKLVSELGKVFAYMQTSYEEAISPESAIDAITLWDGDQIDVTVQMDVDEFFNLLFDRLESQIVDPKVCNAFKSIYGGQLVQQIKSKECDHVSERLEPFTAVQVEIKGKATLEESLRAYVEGEVLQGENKYSCTGCGKHVDAVKRACLKTVPDHLIFNLKRFDYDIMTGMRCKVNDEFSFPESIDMAPYTLEALANPGQAIGQDRFELVGIIIHSGTAESGHYYSYIRQRPSATTKENSWVQFNDHDVTQFDPTSIRECCFGGVDYSGIQCPKFYNGYMLFYQRSSSIQEFERKYLHQKRSGPVCLPVAASLEGSIEQHNELFLRSYVAQDPVHAKFIRALLQLKQTNVQLRCAPHHGSISTKLLTVALDYVNRLSARWKELPEVEETLNLLRTYAADCETCAQVIIKWSLKDDNLADNLVRSCYANLRKAFMILITTCWNKLSYCVRHNQPGSEENDENLSLESYSTTLRNFLDVMAEGWEHLQRHARSWDNYFGTLVRIIRTGQQEAHLTIEAGFVELTLELIHIHVPSFTPPKRLRSKYQTYLSARDRNRPFTHSVLLQVFSELLQHVNLAAKVTELDERVVSNDKIGLSMSEAFLLGLLSQPPQLSWLKKIIYGRCNHTAANSIVMYLCQTNRFDILLCNLLKDGLGDRNLMHAIACLQPTVAFVSCCTSREVVADLASDSLLSIETTNGQYGKEFLNFVQEMLRISNTEASIPEGGLKPLVKKHIPNWAPVLLMAPTDIHADVRSDTIGVLNEALFAEMEHLRQTDPRRYRQDVNICKSLVHACITHIETTFINARSPVIQAGQAHQVCEVVNHCLRFFGETASDEDEAARVTTVIEEFRARSEGIIEAATDAEWNASSDFENLSEVDNMSDTSN